MPVPRQDIFSMLEHPLMMLKSSFHTMMLEQVVNPSSSFLEIPSYGEVQADVAAKLKKETDVNVVYWLQEKDIPDNSVAYHPIMGVVRYNYCWWGFSTKEFMERMQMAEENPAICAHFLHVDSPGGVSYGLDVASEVVKNANKPVVVFVEGLACSAAYFLACKADAIYAGSKFDTIGSIGTMISLVDIEPYWEKLGIKTHDIYADQSPLKNDTVNQALDGQYDKIKEQCLNPLAEDFINTVKSARKKATDEDIYKGETYFSTLAVDNGLIDGIKPMGEVLQEAMKNGKKQNQRNNILTTL